MNVPVCRLSGMRATSSCAKIKEWFIRGTEPTRDDDWERALGAWTHAALARGDTDVHANAKARFEKALLDAALDHTDGHRQQAAERLGLGRNTITRKLGSSRKPGSR